MYEKRNGSARLVNVLRDVAEDERSLLRLADLLHYLPEQLAQDLRALDAVYDDVRHDIQD